MDDAFLSDMRDLSKRVSFAVAPHIDEFIKRHQGCAVHISLREEYATTKTLDHAMRSFLMGVSAKLYVTLPNGQEIVHE